MLISRVIPLGIQGKEDRLFEQMEIGRYYTKIHENQLRLTVSAAIAHESMLYDEKLPLLQSTFLQRSRITAILPPNTVN